MGFNIVYILRGLMQYCAAGFTAEGSTSETVKVYHPRTLPFLTKLPLR